jgi:putative hydrolase of the HAD superfamily
MNIDVRSIRCVAFDAVGTLIRPVPSAAATYHLVAQRHGSRLTEDEIGRRFHRRFRETEQGDLAGPPELRLATSELAERKRWHAIVTAVIDDVKDRESCFVELFEHFSRPESWQCFADVRKALDRIREAGLGVALASNFDGRLHRVCEGLAELRSIDCRVISAEVGHRKPSRRFFEALTAAAGCRPEELLMVGDDHENDWEGARQSGIAAVLINREGEPGPKEISGLADLTARLGL